MSNRHVLRGRVAALLAVLALLAACGDGGNSGGSASEGSTTVKPAELAFNEDAVLKVAWNGPTTTLDPHLQKHLGDQPYHFLTYDRLIEALPDLELGPMLATSWEFTADGNGLDLELRDDVTFSDGSKFNADVVKSNIERAKTLAGSTVAASLALVESVEVLAPDKVRFLVTGAAAELPATLATNAGAMISGQALNAPDLQTNPVGSGPYLLVSYDPNVKAVYEPNLDHWDSDRSPLVGRLEVHNIPPSNTRMSALRSGEVNAIKVTIDQLEEAKQLAETGEFKLHTQPFSLLQYVLFLNNTKGPLADVKVRTALDYAVDAELIAESLLDGECQATRQLFPEGHSAHVASIKPRHDVARAKALLTEAGYPDGFSMKAATNASQSPNDQITLAVQEQLAAVGVEMEIVPLDPTEAIAQFSSGGTDAYLASITGATDASVTIARHITGGRNPGTVTPKLKELATSAADHRNFDEREELLKDVVELTAEETNFVPICFPHNFYLSTPDVVGLADMSWLFTGNMDLRTVGMTDSE